MKLLMARALGVALAAVATLLPARASAQSKVDLERAERLFQEGKALMAEKRYELACPRLEQSQRIDPATGTLLALALCHESEGRIATAYQEFKRAMPAAQSEKRKDREALAQAHLNDLLPRLPKLVLRVPSELWAQPAFTLKLDGQPLARDAAAAPIFVDPGERVIEAGAEGRAAFRTSLVFIEKETQAADVTLDEPGAQKTADRPSKSATTIPMRPIAIGLIGAGGVALALGTAFGLSAIGKNSDAKDLCVPSACSSAEGLKLNDDARTDATTSTVFFALGIVAGAGGGALFYLSDQKQKQARTVLVPAVGAGYAGFAGRGSF